MNLIIFSWSCQGCASSKFPHIFREYNREFKPGIVGLLDMRVNGGKIDSVIARLRFYFPHHVEAIRFYEGIWIGCKESNYVEIL